MLWELIEGFDVERVEREAKRILSRIGLIVPREDLRERLKRMGKVKVEGKKVLISESLFDQFAQEIRKRSPGAEAEEREDLFIFAWRRHVRYSRV